MMSKFIAQTLRKVDATGGRELTYSRYDFRKKRVGIIGNGSSAIQIVPSLQPLEGIQMTVFMRSQTWISGAFGDAAMLALGLDPNDIECECRLGVAM